MNKAQIAAAIEAFKKAWILLGFKGWIADILTAINENKVSTEDLDKEIDKKLQNINPSISEADKTAIAKQVSDAMPIFKFPSDVFSEKEEMIDGKKQKVITLSNAVMDRFKKLEKFNEDIKIL